MMRHVVNGEDKECTPDEEAKYRAEWAAEDERRAIERENPPTVEDKLKKFGITLDELLVALGIHEKGNGP